MNSKSKASIAMPGHGGMQNAVYLPSLRSFDDVEDTFMLITGYLEDLFDPAAWTSLHNGGRMSYTSFGDQNDFTQQLFLCMVAQEVLCANG